MASSTVISAIRGAILVLALVVFLGNIMMWIIMPTDTYYNDWLLHILADTNSTFFGIQGPIMLDFTFPILFIAVLDVYISTWEREEAVPLKGMKCLVLAYYVRPWYKQVPVRSMSRGEKVWQTKLDRVAIVTGVTGNLCLTFLFYPVTRGSSILPMLGLTSEASIKYHIWLGNLAMSLFTAHGFLYILYWSITHRLSESREKVRLVSARVLPCETIELNFSKSRGLKYNPTSTIFINVPTISKLQWHPFTITSNSNLEPERLSIVIKCEGSWSQKLYDIISSPSSIDRLQVSVEGPYGPASTHFLRHDVLVMISGGSGITPFISIIRELLFISSTLKCKAPRIMLISVFKNSSHLSILDLILPTSGAPSNSGNLDLQIEAYVTREKGQSKDKLQNPRTIWFKPAASDAPISPALGPNSWLWLAAIISSSFIIYLVLLGVFTQYVVYPIDQNTNNLYSYTKKGSMNMLFICFSIIIAASAAFLWNKKQNAKEAMQIQDMEESVTSRSSNSSIDHDDVEMESLPLQSTIKSINIHYGQRPNLKSKQSSILKQMCCFEFSLVQCGGSLLTWQMKKLTWTFTVGILSEIKDSSVGALVSGPKEMRQDVAAICSSGLADNLHFESISFTW
ncbi:UNVERIFIED_CONTAM: Ferric reduction oxidase 2 [Sesamum angustifolium]|uniref:ferric-chelate reductase (NADH) n=1 Tax=Sesamum angustifolium TaxID=2727405 RepID=A0AAW2RHE5_9LAMI